MWNSPLGVIPVDTMCFFPRSESRCATTSDQWHELTRPVRLESTRVVEHHRLVANGFVDQNKCENNLSTSRSNGSNRVAHCDAARQNIVDNDDFLAATNLAVLVGQRACTRLAIDVTVDGDFNIERLSPANVIPSIEMPTTVSTVSTSSMTTSAMISPMAVMRAGRTPMVLHPTRTSVGRSEVESVRSHGWYPGKATIHQQSVANWSIFSKILNDGLQFFNT